MFVSTNNELRWSYYADDEQLPAALGAVVARFDSLMAEIGLLAGSKDAKGHLYKLLGKNLGLAMNSESPVDVSTAFAGAERQIRVFAASSGHETATTGAAGVPFDVAVICALHDPELAAVLALSAWTRGPVLVGDPQTYYTSSWNTAKGRSLRVVAAAPNHMGLTAAGVLSAKVVLQFQPRLVVMAGIAAGTKAKSQGFGDVHVPAHIRLRVRQVGREGKEANDTV